MTPNPSIETRSDDGSERRAPTAASFSRLRAALALGSVIGISLLYACGPGGFVVGEIRERSHDRALQTGVEAIRLEPVATFQSNDSPSPVWSPSGNALAYSENWSGRMYLFDVDSAGPKLVYDGNSSALAQADARYNVHQPTFLNDREIIAGPAYVGSLDAADTWSEVIIVDTVAETARVFGSYGRNPQVSHDGAQVLLQAPDGLRLTDTSGTEIRRYPQLWQAQWAPHDNSFVAVQYESYQGDRSTLVLVTEDGTIERLQDRVWEPKWAPSGDGLAFTRSQSNHDYFDPNWEYGTVYYLDLESREARVVFNNARSPSWNADPPLLFFDTRSGLGVSDLKENRIFRDVVLQLPKVSPSGYIAGVRSAGSDMYYTMMEVAVYSFSVQ